MLISTEPLVRQPPEEPQVALAYQALARLCGFFYFDTHPKLLIGREKQGFSLSISRRINWPKLLDKADFSQSCVGFVAFERCNCNLLMSAYQGHAVGWVLELEYRT